MEIAVERTCAYCGKPAEGKFSIHRDGFGEGPEVDLCDRCGLHPTPTCPEIWAKISQKPKEHMNDLPLRKYVMVEMGPRMEDEAIIKKFLGI